MREGTGENTNPRWFPPHFWLSRTRYAGDHCGYPIGTGFVTTTGSLTTIFSHCAGTEIPGVVVSVFCAAAVCVRLSCADETVRLPVRAALRVP